MSEWVRGCADEDSELNVNSPGKFSGNCIGDWMMNNHG